MLAAFIIVKMVEMIVKEKSMLLRVLAGLAILIVLVQVTNLIWFASDPSAAP